MYILGQSFGILAAITSIFRPQFKRRKHIFFCTLLGNLFCTLNFVLIGKSGAASLVCTVAIIQSLLAMLHDRHNRAVPTREKIIFLILYLAAGLFGFAYSQNFSLEMHWDTAIELMPVLGALMLMFSNFARKEQTIRFFLLLNAGVWMIYSLLIGSSTVLSNIISLCSTATALWKYRRK